MDFRREEVASLAQRVRRAELSAVELTQHALSVIDAKNPELNAFVAIDAEHALEQAAAIDQLVVSGSDPGPLAGIPLAVKDLEDAAGFTTTFGSLLFADAPKATTDSALVARLRQAGCVVVGKTNTAEFGSSANTSNGLFGTTSNPWNPDHSPGGSSGGSAVAIAAGMVPLATGTDGGGSLRIPSAACGLSGMKTSYGRVPNGGDRAPDWLILTHKGPMARRISDLAAALEVVVGPDPKDLSSLPRPEASLLSSLRDPRLPGRVGWSSTLGFTTADREVLAACERALGILDELGIEIIDIDGPFQNNPLSAWSTLAAAGMARTYGTMTSHPRFQETSMAVQILVERGSRLDAVSVISAFDAAYACNAELVELFHDVRLLLTPTTAAVPPPHLLNGSGLINGAEHLNWARFTEPFNLTGSPAATVCVGHSADGVPIGLQIVGPQHADLAVLRAAAALEEAMGLIDLVPEELDPRRS
jgi:Asp-tRNA(Asn)/Glu-tRNA(Gln) amidotransferase A subunit family amidase